MHCIWAWPSPSCREALTSLPLEKTTNEPIEKSMGTKNRWGVVIDCDNMSHVFAATIFQRIGQRSIISISGAEGALKQWQPTIERLHLTPLRPTGGKNAADRLLQAEVWKWFTEQHLTHFVFVTNDGGFAKDIRALQAQGCICYVIGYKKASRRLQEACSRFIRVKKPSKANQKRSMNMST
jgi:hypothetical protein